MINTINTTNSLNIALQVDGLVKFYGMVKAVDNLSFKVYGGEIYGLLGPNGAGKSTTIKSILGLISVNAGKISVLGLDPVYDPVRVKEVIGYVPEEPSLYDSMSPRELFDFIVSIRKLDPQKTFSFLQYYLNTLDVIPYVNSIIGSLSKGNKQKIQIITALLHEPRILVLDEPLSGLDVRSAHILKQIFQYHLQRGGSIVLSTHVMEQAQILCHRIGIINKGRLVVEGTFEELRTMSKSTNANLEEIFLQLTEQDVTVSPLLDSYNNNTNNHNNTI